MPPFFVLNFLHLHHNSFRLIESVSKKRSHIVDISQLRNPRSLFWRDFWAIQSTSLASGFFEFDKKQTSALENYAIIRKSLRHTLKCIFSANIMKLCESFVWWMMEKIIIRTKPISEEDGVIMFRGISHNYFL